MSGSNPGTPREAIAFHYDVSNDYYALWLDETMSYSCALYRSGEETLHHAQLAKIDHHLEQAGAAGCARLLDVGCGWGGIVRRAVAKAGVEHAVGLTLSRNQVDWITGEDDPRIQVRLESWSDHKPEELYDAVISCGAFEHFARPEFDRAKRVGGYRRFFEKCWQWSKPGACLSLQTMAYGNFDRDDRSSFLITQVFPETELPSLTDIAEAIDGRFELVRLWNDREHYVRTHRDWLKRLKATRERAVALAGEQTVGAMLDYLRVMMVAFHIGNLDLLRMKLRRVDRPYR